MQHIVSYAIGRFSYLSLTIIKISYHFLQESFMSVLHKSNVKLQRCQTIDATACLQGRAVLAIIICIHVCVSHFGLTDQNSRPDVDYGMQCSQYIPLVIV